MTGIIWLWFTSPPGLPHDVFLICLSILMLWNNRLVLLKLAFKSEICMSRTGVQKSLVPMCASVYTSDR